MPVASRWVPVGWSHRSGGRTCALNAADPERVFAALHYVRALVGRWSIAASERRRGLPSAGGRRQYAPVDWSLDTSSEWFGKPGWHWSASSRSAEIDGGRCRLSVSVWVSATSAWSVRVKGQRLNDGSRLSTPEPALPHRTIPSKSSRISRPAMTVRSLQGCVGGVGLPAPRERWWS